MAFPYLGSSWWNDLDRFDRLDRPSRLLDQEFGIGLHPEQLTPSLGYEPPYYSTRRRSLYPTSYYRPWGDLMRQGEGGGTSTVKADKDKFQVILDVQQFKPEEISVKVKDRYVVVEGKHEEKEDEHGSISRHFIRRYLIPQQCNMDEVTSNLSSDGVLTINAPRKELEKKTNEKTIKIEVTGKPAIEGKKDGDDKKKDEKKK